MVPTISVLMPVYNTALFLKDAVDSILAQTFTNFEFIIIDDGSTDESMSILSEYSDARLQVISRENRGISSTRNELISMASAKYIAWMDSDDISALNRFEEQLKLMCTNKYVVVGGGAELIDEAGMKIGNWHIPFYHKEIDDWHINGRGGAIVFPSAMMDKQSVMQIGGFDERLQGAEDLCLILRLAEIGQIINLKETIIYYRQHINSISHDKKLIIHQDTKLVIQNACKRRGLATKSVNFNDELTSYYHIYSKWSWWALRGGNIKTARKYAFRVLLVKPYSPQAWRLVACALRGY